MNECPVNPGCSCPPDQLCPLLHGNSTVKPPVQPGDRWTEHPLRWQAAESAGAFFPAAEDMQADADFMARIHRRSRHYLLAAVLLVAACAVLSLVGCA